MRTVNDMIEFKKITGSGTRLYDGKDYFAIYDLVKAHRIFSDPEWYGEPVEPTNAIHPGVARSIHRPHHRSRPPARNHPAAK